MHSKVLIKSFDFLEVIVPAHEGVINSKGLDKPLHMLPVSAKQPWRFQFDQLPKLLVKMTLSNGIVGLGEFYRDHSWPLIEEIAESLLGVAVEDLTLQALPILLSREYDGFECAIWDAVAKTRGIPLHQMLGGAYQKKIKVGAWSSHRTKEEVGPWVSQYQARGFDCIKFKSDLEDDVYTLCLKIKEHAPLMKIIFDPNQRFENAGEARQRLSAMEKVGNVMIVEDPMPLWMLQDYADLRKASNIRIIRHIALPYIWQGQRPHDIINVLLHRAADGFNFNGGLAKFQMLSHIAQCANMYFWHGSEIDLGILEVMYVHQSAATKNCIWPSDIFGRMIRVHDLLKTPLQITPPYVHLPSGAGLGVELDEEALEKFQTREKRVG